MNERESMADQSQSIQCLCYDAKARYTVFCEQPIGTEQAHYADISLLTCNYCRSIWLRFLLEYEAFSGSGRYYRGLISPEIG